MGLLDLPGELLDEIITLTLPNGLESLVLSCKTISQRATAQIEHHNKLKKQWRYAANPSNDRRKPLHLLYQISRDALLADYIDTLRLYSVAGSDGSPSEASFIDFISDEENMDRIEKLVTESHYLQKAGVDVKDWWANITKEDEQEDEDDEEEASLCAVVSLLGQLPELQSFQPPHRWQDIQPLEDAFEYDKQLIYVLESLIEYSKGQGHQARPLKKLKTILPFMPAGYDGRAALQCVEPLLSLPSMRELFLVSCLAVNDDTYTGIPFKWRSPLDSPLRRIELAYCCMDTAGISSLLEHTPLLEVFKYSHETKWHGCEHDWNPGTFVEAIARHCSSTITSLAITIDQLYGEIVNGTSTFLKFPKLRFLEVDVQVFCGPPIESGQKKGLNSTVPPGEKPWTVHDIPCIGSMINSDIVELQINLQFPKPDEEALRSLLKDIKEQKAARLHELECVILRQYDGNSAEEIFGIPGLVVVFDGSKGGERDSTMLPAWKREFEARVGGIATL